MQVGDIYYDSWGYEQTNIDFYQVTAVNKGSFTIRRIKSSFEGYTGNGIAGYKRAVKDAFMEDEPEITKRSLSTEFGYLSKTTEEKTHYYSWYA